VIPIGDTPKSGSAMILRVDKPSDGKNYKSIKWASKYEI